MRVEVDYCEGKQLAAFVWPAGAEFERAYTTPLVEHGVAPYFANVQTSMALLRVDRWVFPVTVNQAEYGNSYVCSPYGGAISYPLVELRTIDSRPVRGVLAAMIGGVAPLLRFGRVNQAVCVNNWLLSTNLYPAWHGHGLPQLTDMLCARYPGHAILFRSLNWWTNRQLCEQFLAAGYLLAPSRQVYLFDGREPDYLRKPNSRWDQKLLQTSSCSIVPHDCLSAKDDQRIRDLYAMLYLEKYSYLNPQFTVALIRLWRQQRLLTMFGLRNPRGRLDGIVGCFSYGGVITAPLVGYDTSISQHVGLYRMLMAIVLREAAERAMTLNLSSGAAGFKRLRGGTPAIEYTAVYCRHLPGYRRRMWQSLSCLLERVAAPVLKKYKL